MLATHNRHKVVELRRILADAGLDDVEVLSADDVPGLPDVAETGTTFAENALGKARAAAAATGQPAIGDDSGVAAEALDGRPGVRSARFAGEHATDAENRDKLIREAPEGSRLAYVCAIAAAWTVRRASMPCAASSRSSSSEVRWSGVRSPVAWTSTRPPSPVMTTFASTSAPLSSR